MDGPSASQAEYRLAYQPLRTLRTVRTSALLAGLRVPFTHSHCVKLLREKCVIRLTGLATSIGNQAITTASGQVAICEY